MTKNARILLLAPAIALGALLAACGGGGSGSSPSSSVIPTIAPTTTPTTSPTSGASASPSPSASPTHTASPSPSPSASASALTVSGTLTEFTSGMPLSGFTVTVGAVPAFTTCLAAQTATTQPCGVAGSPAVTTTTSSSGAFSVAVPTAGTYFLTIGLNSTYATLHREITIAAGGLALGTMHVAALSSDEQNWLVDVNAQRAAVSFPVSFGNLVVDEYAEENARAMAAAVANGSQPFGDATELIYDNAFEAEAGGFLGNGSTMSSAANIGQFVTSDNSLMAEKANCPGGSWQTCTFASNTGHYINVSNTDDVWVGMGEAQSPSGTAQYPGAIYCMIFPQDDFGPAPASTRRSK